MLATLLLILTEDEDVLDRLQRQIEEESSSGENSSDESDDNMDTSEPGPSSQREQTTNGRGSDGSVNRGRGRSRGRGGRGRGRGRRGRGGRERGFGTDRTEKRNIGKRITKHSDIYIQSMSAPSFSRPVLFSKSAVTPLNCSLSTSHRK